MRQVDNYGEEYHIYRPVRLVRPLHQLPPHNSGILSATAARRCTVGGAIAGGSLFGSGLLRALWYVIGQLCSVLSWFRGSQCIAKLPCTASSHCCFVGNARARVTPSTGECRGDGPDRMWYQCSAQLHSPKHHCHSINATLHHCTRAKLRVRALGR